MLRKKLGVGTVIGCLLVVSIAACKSKFDYDAMNLSSASQQAAKPSAAQDSVTITDLQSKQMTMVSLLATQLPNSSTMRSIKRLTRGSRKRLVG